jgi:hypothetical protein
MANLSRRQFSKLASATLLGLATSASISLTGCSAFANISAWIPVATTAIDGIVSLLGALVPPPAAAIISAVKAALADLGATIAQYNADTNPADKATLLSKIRTLLNDVASNFQNFLVQLNLAGNPIITIVIGLANIIFAAIAGFLNQLPPAPAAAKGTTLSSTYHIAGANHQIVPKLYKSVGEFKKDFNAVCVADGHPEIAIK